MNVILNYDLALKIIEQIANGELASKVCKKEGVNWGSWWRYCQQHEELRSMYASSREQQYRLIADNLIDLVDEKPACDANGKMDPGSVTWQRNRVDTRKWLISKILPKEYGDKVVLDENSHINIKVVNFKEDEDTK